MRAALAERLFGRGLRGTTGTLGLGGGNIRSGGSCRGPDGLSPGCFGFETKPFGGIWSGSGSKLCSSLGMRKAKTAPMI